MNRDGSSLRRLTNHPDDRRHADLVADRHSRSRSPPTAPAAPQIYIVNIDGTGLQQITREIGVRSADLVAGAVQRDRLHVAVGRRQHHQDLRLRHRQTRALTDAIGNNESPAFSPNGRHIAFVSTRAGKEQIFTSPGRHGAAADHPDRAEPVSELVASRVHGFSGQATQASRASDRADDEDA